MPKADCVNYRGKIYCYDKATKKATVYEPKPIELRECPEQVLKTFFEISNYTTVVLDCVEEPGNAK